MNGYFERIEDHLLDAVGREAAAPAPAKPTNAAPGRAAPAAPARRRPRAARPSRTTRRSARTRPSRITRRPARTRIAVATAAGLAAIVALAVAGLLAAVGGSGPDHAALDRPQSLDDVLAVLRRDQRPGDAPAPVVFEAITAAQSASGPFRGTVDAGGVRRLVGGGATSGGLRAYLAPIRAAGAAAPPDRGHAAAGAQAALVLLTDARDRLVQYPYGVTVADLGDGRAWYLAYGLRAEPGPRETAAPRTTLDGKRDGAVRRMPDAVARLMRMRSLQLQLVPDGVATVAYRYSPQQVGTARPSGRRAEVEVPVADNAAVTVLRGNLAHGNPASATLLDDAGGVVDRAVPVVRGRGPLAPGVLCRGVALPARPSGRPVIRMAPTTVRDICRQAGLPQTAYRRDNDSTIALWPDGTVIVQRDGRAIGAVWHLEPGGEFPPRFTDLLPPARKLGHYQIAPRP